MQKCSKQFNIKIWFHHSDFGKEKIFNLDEFKESEIDKIIPQLLVKKFEAN